MERPRDEGLQGNERIEEAIALLQTYAFHLHNSRHIG